MVLRRRGLRYPHLMHIEEPRKIMTTYQLKEAISWVTVIRKPVNKIKILKVELVTFIVLNLLLQQLLYPK